jgi:ligand-binding sensor domain-containing protein
MKFKSHIVCLLILLLNSVIQLNAQKYSFVQYSVEQGLTQTQVYSIDTDEQGFLWFGTAGGVSKFDGKHFQNYSSANGLVDNVVNAIKFYKGYTWIFTNKGITRIKGNEIFKYELTELVLGNFISSGTISSERGSIIIGVKNNDIIEIPLSESCEPLLKETINLSSPLGEGTTVRSIYIDQKGVIWIAANGFIGRLLETSPGSFHWTSIVIENSNYNVSDVIQDTKGDYWISVYSEGVYKWNEGVIEKYDIDNGLVSRSVRTLFEDTNGKIWCASKNGISVISEDEVTIFNSTNGLPNENIEMVVQDQEGNIWLASDGSGAYRFTSEEFVTFDQSNGLGSNYVMTLLQDSTEDYWFGTYGNGITKWDGHNFEYYNVENQKILNNVVWSSLKDARNNLWFGTSNGLILLANNDITTFQDELWMPSNKVTSLYQSRINVNEIWVGSSKGLSILNTEAGIISGKQLNAKLKNVRAIESGTKNQVWLGTSNGVFVTDGTFLEPWIYNDKLEDKVVYSIENFKDSLWFIGTSNGLYSTNGLQVERMYLDESFSSNYINFLTLEGNNLWVGTNYGIFEIKLSEYLNNRNKGIIHHTQNSGIQSVETNLNSGYFSKDGKVWMGTGKGLIRFDRNKRRESVEATVPNIVLNEVQLFFKKTDWSKYSDSINQFNGIPYNPSLSHKSNYLTFYFQGISLSNYEDVRYRVKLEGLDQEWSPIIFQNTFTYTNLGYGDYEFKVIASVDGISWSEAETFIFEIRKPYFLTWWFFSLIFVFVLIIVWVIYIWRRGVVRRKRKIEKLVFKSKLLALEQQTLNASMNRHFIFNALNSIQYYINTQDRLSANRYLTSFAKLIRKNLDSSISGSGLVTLADEIERLELYISLEHMRFQEKFEYKINVAGSIDVESVKIPAMILQPFVENSIWHGILPQKEGGLIEVNITDSEKGILFEIMDNGIGYDISQSKKTDNLHHSKGMLITNGRIDLLKKANEKKMSIKGPFQINDANGHSLGTKVEILLETETFSNKKQ